MADRIQDRGALPPPPAPFDVTQAAFYLSRDESYVRRMVRERKIAFFRVTGRLRFSQRDLDAHLEQGRVEVGGIVGLSKPATGSRAPRPGGRGVSRVDLVPGQPGRTSAESEQS